MFRYEPRAYLFPVFEMARRLFLTSVLAVCWPGTMQQVSVAMLGAGVSFGVYAFFEAYIEDDDDVVSTVAQAELVLLSIRRPLFFSSPDAWPHRRCHRSCCTSRHWPSTRLT